MNKTKTYFLTGATGLLGSYLTKMLLKNGHKVYALTRPKNNESANQRVHNILNFWDKNILKNYSANLNILEGDVTQKNMGLSKGKINILKKEVTEIFHCAANTNFFDLINNLRKINVDGTNNLLNLCLELKNNGVLKKVNHISTVFVAGKYKGVFQEKNLDVNQKFNSFYEQTKFESELVVEKFRKKNLFIDVFRPAVIVGESHTGKTFRFDHIYKIFRLWSKEMVNVFPIRNAPLYLAHVDITAKSIYELSKSSKGMNSNHHLCSNKCSTTVDSYNEAKRLIGFEKPKKVDWNYNLKNLSSAEQQLIQAHMLFNKMLFAKISSALTKKILKKNNISLDSDKTSLACIINYAIKCGFIKNKL